MVVYFGTKFYGKVDRVPNLFYVRTRFFHVQFLPLVPLGSFLLIEGTNEERGVKIPLSIKSILTAWVRAALVLIAVGHGIAASVHVVQVLSNQPERLASALQHAVWLAGACLVYWMTVRFSRASYNRAIQLGAYLGLEPSVVEKFWYGDPSGRAEGLAGNADRLAGSAEGLEDSAEELEGGAEGRSAAEEDLTTVGDDLAVAREDLAAAGGDLAASAERPPARKVDLQSGTEHVQAAEEKPPSWQKGPASHQAGDAAARRA